MNKRTVARHEADHTSSPQLSSSNLAAFIEISPDALVLINQAGSILMVNRQAEALFGYARSQLLGQPLERLLPERFHTSHREHWTSFFSAPHPRPMGVGLAVFGLQQDGSEFPVDISLKPLLLDGKMTVLAAVRDMSTQRRIEEELIRRRMDETPLTTLNKILSAIAEYVLLLDLDSRYLFLSENTAELLGVSQHEVVGKTWQELGLPAAFMAPFEKHRQTLLATHHKVLDETFFPTSMGERRLEYLITPVLDRQGELEAVIVVARDVTELRHMEDAARRLASIVESSDEAIIGKDLDGTILSWNKGAEQLYGYRAQEVMGKSVKLLFPPERAEDLSDILSRLRRGEHIPPHETIRVKKDGTQVVVSMTFSPIRDSKGTIIGASSIAHDLSERKQAEDALIASRDELAIINTALTKANLIRSQFLATMSHELRTPLASMMGFSEMLLEDAMKVGLNEQQRSNLESIFRNSEHLLGLINDVLDLSKIEAGRMVLNYQQVHVSQLLDALITEIGPLARARHLFLKVEVEEGIDCLETDPGKVNQLLLNLVSNALKFTERGGVTLTATKVFPSDNEAERIDFAVIDTGIGIPQDIQERIFEAFYQADMSYTRKVGGTGLGLSIVSQLAVLLGGKVTVDSVMGQGSTFTVSLPLRANHRFVGEGLPRLHPPQHQNVTLSPSPGERVPGRREALAGQERPILVIDDNPDTITLVESALKEMPFPIIGVEDPLRVLELVQELHPRAILLDVMMPELNGWQLLHQLKDNSTTASIPVIMLTVLDEQAIGYVLGADDYVIKPFKKEVIARNTSSEKDTFLRVVFRSVHTQRPIFYRQTFISSSVIWYTRRRIAVCQRQVTSSRQKSLR